MDELQTQVSAAAFDNITDWLEQPKYQEYRQEVQALIDTKQWQVLEDSFFKVLEFGTAGRRGTTGVGSNRINRVTIGESAQALCEYALSADPEAAAKGIAIACDTRLSSPELTRYVATVCAAAGFKTYIFDGYRSTPQLSFTVRYLGCAAGIVISASHNPPADNGFKAYWNDGGQMAAPHDSGILETAAKIQQITSCDYDEALASSRIVVLSQEHDAAYIAAVAAVSEGSNRDVSIVYSPLHGAGQRNTLPVLKAVGFNNVAVVESQMIPDGNFPTIENGKPNPEEPEANELAVAQMMNTSADIAITNDPDADRIGVMLRHNDQPIYLTGNQAGVLATQYTLQAKQAKGELTPQHYIVKTIVTTDLLASLAQKYAVGCYGNLLIGFKYIAKVILSKEPDETFVIAVEESFGALKGDYARDKDGASAAVPLAEYAAELKAEGRTLFDALLDIYAEHGMYMERLDTLRCEGANGFEQMKTIMENLRQSPPNAIGDHRVTAVYDYASLTRTNVVDGSTSTIDCDSGNVFVLEFGDARRRIMIRPSGTEPKLKLYTLWYDDPQDNILEQYHTTQGYLEGFAKQAEGLLLSVS